MTEYTLKEIEQGAWLVEIEGLSGGGPHGMEGTCGRTSR